MLEQSRRRFVERHDHDRFAEAPDRHGDLERLVGHRHGIVDGVGDTTETVVEQNLAWSRPTGTHATVERLEDGHADRHRCLIRHETGRNRAPLHPALPVVVAQGIENLGTHGVGLGVDHPRRAGDFQTGRSPTAAGRAVDHGFGGEVQHVTVEIDRLDQDVVGTGYQGEAGGPIGADAT